MSDTDTPDVSNEKPAPETRPPSKQAVNYAAGPGRMDGIDARIASIEAHVDHIRDDFGDVRRDFRELTKSLITSSKEMRDLDDRITSLPGKGWMFMAMLLFTLIICAVIIYVDQIRDFLKVLPLTSTLP